MTEKMMLIIDKPIDCQSCLCSDYEEGYCEAFGDGRTNLCDWNSGVISSWCPLRPLPEKKQHEEEVDYDYGYIDGWNACIEELEK